MGHRRPLGHIRRKTPLCVICVIKPNNENPKKPKSQKVILSEYSPFANFFNISPSKSKTL